GGRRLEARTLSNSSLNLSEFCKSKTSQKSNQHHKHQNHSFRHTLSKFGTKQWVIVWVTIRRRTRLFSIDFIKWKKDSEFPVARAVKVARVPLPTLCVMA